MLDENRLKGKIKQAFIDEQNEQQDHNGSVDRIAQKIAKAVVDEVKEIQITYTPTLVAPSGGGIVTGTFTYTID
jgi:hypothetical protein